MTSVILEIFTDRIFKKTWESLKNVNFNGWLINKFRFGISHVDTVRVGIDELSSSNGFFAKPNARIIQLMGQSLTALLKDRDVRSILKCQIIKGCEIQILLVSPYRTARILQFLQKTKASNFDNHAQKELEEKIFESLYQINELRKELTDEQKLKLRVRITENVMYNSLYRVDDQMIVSFYKLSDSQGRDLPTMQLVAPAPNYELASNENNGQLSSKDRRNKQKPNGKTLFTQLVKEFDYMFGKADLPYMLEHKEFVRDAYHTAANIKKALNSEEELPPPDTAIIYPTYDCLCKCSYCMYDKYHYGRGEDQNMDLSTLKTVINELISFNVKNIEFAGGGEPTDYGYFGELLEHINEIKAKKTNVSFGLLSNGLWDESLTTKIANLNYCRMSFNERVANASNVNERNIFNKNLEQLVELKSDTKIDITLKFLLANNNWRELVNEIKNYANYGVDFIKIKSIRGKGLAEESILRTEEALYTCMSDIKKDKLQVDLRRTPYQLKFKCLYSPFITVIDPKGDIYICYNYSEDEEEKKLGNISDGFKNVWLNDDHKNKIKHLTVENCSLENYSNCRIFDYQDVIEEQSFFAEMNKSYLSSVNKLKGK